MLRRILQALVLTALLGILTACAGSGSDITVNPEGSIILDVRTPDEFSTGHIVGAVNVDISAGDFESRIANFDTASKYLVYCRSGNRSSQAVAKMQELGFSNLVDLGSVDAASTATGLGVIR